MKNESDTQLDARLDQALKGLRDPAVASNFTARVMREIDTWEARRGPTMRFHRWSWRFLLPRAVVAAVLVFAGIAAHRHEVNVRRAVLADSVAVVAMQPMPSVDALKNFDAIRRMSQPAAADDELLALAPDLK
ncbi:MAG: hypothetical protein KGR98_08025 [Verrucomicrobia bacterium]|nr:hypothetical protein [Verrucomicrobiota bacterium]MDE3097921.1 hypothetical protein [Verrucomicrobiota bacterium]